MSRSWFSLEHVAPAVSVMEADRLRESVEGVIPDEALAHVVDDLLLRWVEQTVDERKQRARKERDVACLREMYEVSTRLRSYETPTLRR